MSRLLLAAVLLQQMLVQPGYSSQQPRETSTRWPCGFELCLNASSSAGKGEGGLLDALKKAHNQKNRNSTEIVLSGGVFDLDKEIGELLVFEKWRNFSLRGQGMDATILHCFLDQNVGLVFRNSSHVSLRNLTLEECARKFTTTSVNISRSDTGDHDEHNLTFVVSWTAVFFDSCSSLTLDGVKVYDSYGTGVTVYNTNGANTFKSCQFESNIAGDSALGGGGVVVETSHCIPGDETCMNQWSELETTDASYTFSHSNFFTNRATSRYLQFNSIYPHSHDHVGLGRGGGLAVILRGRALRNWVVLDHCSFEQNQAEWGGAIYLNFGDISVSNSVVIKDSWIMNNNFRDGANEYSHSITAGGGMRVEIVSYPADNQLWPGYISNVTNNSITVLNSHISKNYASWGAGVSFVTTRDLPGSYPPNSLLFEGCTFKGNTAEVVGSAVDISSWKPDLVDSGEPFMKPTLSDCSFESNFMTFSNITNHQVGMGIVYVAGVPTNFEGQSLFLGNENTALVLSQTYITILESSTMTFTRNTGRRGGALAFIGSSWLIAGENTSFLFDGNWVGAYGLGGAVYSVHFGEHDLSYDQNCFFRYHKYSLPPSQWNTTFTFLNNSADSHPNSIYTTSSLPCDWNAAMHVSGNSSTSPLGGGAFCENSTFVFEGPKRGCWNEIATGPSRVSVEKIYIDVHPGWAANLGVHVLNDFGLHVPPVLVASPSRGDDKEVIAIANSTNYITDDTIVIHGKENDSASLLLMTLDPRVVASEVVIQVKSCPPGFVSTPCPANSTRGESGMTCDCVCQQNVPGVECNNDTKEAYVLSYYCITLQSNSPQTAVGNCPYNQRSRTKISNLTASELSGTICRDSHRQGFLCSKCQDGYGVAVNTHNYYCTECEHGERYGWALYLLLELGPITVVCFLVILFGVGVASPSMNAFIFFSQIVSVTYNTNRNVWFFGVNEGHSQSLATAVYVLYGVWNLEFLRDVAPPICLHQGLRTLHILVINYIKALYPMLLLGVCYIFIKLYDRNTKALHVLWKPFRYCQKAVHRIYQPKTSIIDAFASLMILSYSKFMYVSFPLLTLISVYELGDNVTDVQRQEMYRYYFDPDEVLHHSTASIMYFILGVVVVVVFVGLPPIFLILYPLRASQRLIGRLNIRLQITLRTFADIFLGAFRDGASGGSRGKGGDGSDMGGSGKDVRSEGGGGDCRWFAGLYFIVRIVFMSIYASPVKLVVEYLVQQILCTLLLFLFAVLRPYKVELYNILDCSFFALLSVLNALSFYNSSVWDSSQKLKESVFFINYALIFLPMMYLVGLLVYVVLRWRRHCSCFGHKAGSSEETGRYDEKSTVTDDEGPSSSEGRFTLDSDRLLPDRLVNPHNYRTLNRMASVTGSTGSSIVEEEGEEGKGGGGEGRQNRQQPSTDQSPLIQAHRRPKVYGGGHAHGGNIQQQRYRDRATS